MGACFPPTGECLPDDCSTYPDRCTADQNCINGLCVSNPCTGVGFRSISHQPSAISLFVERARDAQASFELTRRNAPAVAQVCRQLDGIPLAIELAAARTNVLTVDMIAARLDDRLGS